MTWNEWDTLSFAAPMPKNYMPFFTVIFAFNNSVWIGILLSCIAISLSIQILSYLGGDSFEAFGLSRFSASIWYTYSTLIGENLRWYDGTKSAVGYDTFPSHNYQL